MIGKIDVVPTESGGSHCFKFPKSRYELGASFLVGVKGHTNVSKVSRRCEIYWVFDLKETVTFRSWKSEDIVSCAPRINEF